MSGEESIADLRPSAFGKSTGSNESICDGRRTARSRHREEVPKVVVDAAIATDVVYEELADFYRTEHAELFAAAAVTCEKWDRLRDELRDPVAPRPAVVMAAAAAFSLRPCWPGGDRTVHIVGPLDVQVPHWTQRGCGGRCGRCPPARSCSVHPTQATIAPA